VKKALSNECGISIDQIELYVKLYWTFWTQEKILYTHEQLWQCHTGWFTKENTVGNKRIYSLNTNFSGPPFMDENLIVYLAKIIKVEIIDIVDSGLITKRDFMVRNWEADTIEFMRKQIEDHRYRYRGQIIVLDRNNKISSGFFLRDVNSVVKFRVTHPLPSHQCNIL